MKNIISEKKKGSCHLGTVHCGIWRGQKNGQTCKAGEDEFFFEHCRWTFDWCRQVKQIFS